MTTKQAKNKTSKQTKKQNGRKSFTVHLVRQLEAPGDDSCYVGQNETHLLGSHVLSTHLTLSRENGRAQENTWRVLNWGAVPNYG